MLDCGHDESRIAPEISMGKAAGFLTEPVQPLCSASLHPGGRLLGSAREKVEGRADSQGGYRESTGKSCDFVILLRSTKAHPHQRGSGLADALIPLGKLLRNRRAKRRTLGAHDCGPWPPPLNLFGKEFQGLG